MEIIMMIAQRLVVDRWIQVIFCVCGLANGHWREIRSGSPHIALLGF